MPTFTTATYNAVRACLDTSLDDAGLPQAVIDLAIYGPAAAAEVLLRDPNADTYTDPEKLRRVQSALAYLTAARIAPALPNLTQFSEGDLRYSLKEFDPTAKAAQLRGMAAAELALNLTGTVTPQNHFWLAAGRRGA
jgi:hypothetical protein